MDLRCSVYLWYCFHVRISATGVGLVVGYRFRCWYLCFIVVLVSWLLLGSWVFGVCLVDFDVVLGV